MEKRTEYWYITDPEKDWKGYPRITPAEDPAGKLAELAANTNYEDIPAKEIDRAKQGVLDTVAVMMGGSSARCVPAVAKSMERWKGMGESKVFFYGYQAPSVIAAMVNGTMARALDFGDVHDTGGHISEFMIPAMLTGLDVTDKKISGKEFLTAYILGAEWSTRQHSACRFQYHPMGLPGECGSIGAAVGLAKMFGGDKEQIWNAAGFAFCANSIGEEQKVFEGVDSQRIEHGFFGSDAIKSAVLAMDGLTAPHGIYFGDCGIFRYIVWDDIEPELLTKELGSYWHWSDGLLVKPYASCKFTHSVVSAMIKLRAQHNINYKDIAGIHCIVAPNADPCIQPSRWNPKSVGEAMFSIPYALAHAAIHGEVFLDAFDEEEFSNPEKLELMQKVTVAISDDPNIPIFDGYTTEITMKNGEKYCMTENAVLGCMSNPMSWEQFEEKFYKCAPYCVNQLPEENLKKIVEMCKHLEDVEDMRELTKLMVP